MTGVTLSYFNLLYLSEVKKIAFLLSMTLLLVSCGKKRETIKPTLADITESIYASGNIKALNQYEVHSPVNAVLLEVLVNPNDSVSVGTPLFKLDGSLEELSVLNAQRNLEFASNNASKLSEKLNEANLNLATAKEKFALDSLLFKKQERLWASKIGSELELSQRKLAFEQSKNAFESAKLEVSFLRNQFDIERDRAALQRDLSMRMLDNYLIRSAVEGKVFQVNAEEGSLISTLQSLAIIGSNDQFYLELEVDENDIMQVSLNQEVIVKLDSYSSEVYAARVSKIYPAMNTKTRTFKVEASFSKTPPSLFPNLSAEANIVLSTKKQALTIPRNYLVNGNEVWISEKEKKTVEIGLIDYDKVEILSGIDTETTLYKPE